MDVDDKEWLSQRLADEIKVVPTHAGRQWYKNTGGVCMGNEWAILFGFVSMVDAQVGELRKSLRSCSQLYLESAKSQVPGVNFARDALETAKKLSCVVAFLEPMIVHFSRAGLVILCETRPCPSSPL